MISGSVEPSALLIENVQADPEFSSHAAAELSPGIRSFIGVPVMLSDDTFYGTLCAVDPEPKTLSRQQADLLVVLARLVATQIERQQVERELRLRDRAIAASNNGIIITDPNLPDNPIVYANEGFLRITGYGLDEVVGRNCRFLQGENRDQPELDELRAAIREDRSCQVVLRNYRKDGTLFWNEVSISPVHDGAGKLVNYIGGQNDITERKALESQLAEDRFRSLVQNASDVVALLGDDGSVLYQSPAAERILGYKPENMMDRSAFDSTLIHPEDLPKARALFAELLASPDKEAAAEVRVRHADGSWRWIEAVGRNLLDDPNVGGIVANYRDTTERKEYEAQLKHRAFHDPLTDLPNRALFADRLERALARAGRRRELVAVLYLDMDRFKLVNDSMGHEAGDEVLRQMAQRLRECLRPADTASRLSGDEFVVLLEDVASEDDARVVVERITRRMHTPFEIKGRQLKLSASIGMALGGGRGAPEDLLRAADVAMYRAKNAGKARLEVYDHEMGVQAFDRVQLEVDLALAVERGEFVVYYQPKVELETGRIAEVEALVRWEHPERGLLSPEAFIGIAEETGLIVPMGQWVLEQACRQVREWQDQHGCYPSLKANVNLSARQFGQPDLVRNVRRALEESGLRAESLELELTESAVLSDGESVMVPMRELTALGVKLAIDDFGTGYSSLAYLKRFPVRTLKIDRQFVAGLGRDPKDTAIVKGVLELGHGLGLNVVAEGVERSEQLELLRTLGCRIGQGPYLCKPLPPRELSAVLSEGISPAGRR